jgi:hypothetical protein
MVSSLHPLGDRHEDEHDRHEQDATSTAHSDGLGSGFGLNKVIPNPLTDTTTTAAEGHRPEITNEQGIEIDKRPEDSWNSNTLTLNQSTETQKAFKRLSTTTQAALDRQMGIDHDWEEIWEKERLAKWREKVEVDLKGWRGGNGYVLVAFFLFLFLVVSVVLLSTIPYQSFGS